MLGAGPGGYTAAFRAADLGMKVTLVERWATLGGVCLNVGCIPSKALLHAAKVIEEAEEMGAHGIAFGEPQIDLEKLRGWKSGVVKKLTGGLCACWRSSARSRWFAARANFVSPHVLEVTGRQRHASASASSSASSRPAPRRCGCRSCPQDPRIIDSTGALELPESPGGLLVIGGGIIGLEMACVYDALGAKVSVVELTPQLMPGCDPDLVRPLEKRIRARYERDPAQHPRHRQSRPPSDGIRVTLRRRRGARAPQSTITCWSPSAARPTASGSARSRPACRSTSAASSPVDKQMRTNVPHIFAIGDIVGQPMLAHKAMHEAKVAAEVAAGQKSCFDARVIPSVAYTDPEVAWVGLTETEAKAQEHRV